MNRMIRLEECKSYYSPVESFKRLKSIQEFTKSISGKHKKIVSEKGVLAFYNEPLKTTLLELQNPKQEKDLLTINAIILEICNSKELLCSSIKTLIKNIMNRDQEFIDEVYLQLYRQSNSEALSSLVISKEFYEKSLFLLSVVSCYFLPSDSLADSLMDWIYSNFKDIENKDLAIKEFLARLEYKKNNMKVTFHYWVPSTLELLAKYKRQPLKLNITFGEYYVIEIEVTESITTKNIMAYLRDESKYLCNESDKHMYWLYRISSRRGVLDKALPGEAKYFEY